MKTIRTKNFNQIKKIAGNEKLWKAICENTEDGIFPYLVGGLDHIEIKPLGIYVHDIGSNGRDNSFVIRRVVQ